MILKSPNKSAPYHSARREKLRRILAENDCDGILVTHMPNVRYLSGFTGTSATMLVTRNGDHFLTDFRYATQALAQVRDADIHQCREMISTVKDLTQELGVSRLAFEAEHTSYAKAEEAKSVLSDTQLSPSKGWIEKVRLIKDAPEMEAIRALAAMLADVFPTALAMMKPGAVERDIAVELEYLLRKHGADGAAFDFIVASGHRGAMPHGVASEKAIGAGELVTLDWGAKGWGYHTDNTRTVAVGIVDAELEKIYDLVLEANTAAIEFTKPGVTTKQIDDVARNIIKAAGYGDMFGHGTGHGVGLDIHEKPTVSWRDETVVEPGMVFTIEPGIYIPGKGGVRIEDMVLATETGCEVITAAVPKNRMQL